MNAVNYTGGMTTTDVDRAIAPNRRERARAATRAEILEAAHALLVDGGTDAITLRAVAGRLGMTAPAIYRYFDSRENLLVSLIAALYDQLAATLRAARDGDPDARLVDRFMVTSLAFRQWALDHRPEFGLLFGAPIPGVAERDADPDRNLGDAFGAVWLELFTELWQAYPVPVAEDEAIDPSLRDQLAGYHARIGAIMPLGAVVLYLACWMRLHGAVATEAFGHLDFALRDGNAEALFAELLTDLAGRLGLRQA